METSFLSTVKPQNVAANPIQWKIIAPTNRASQTGEAKNLACVVHWVTNGDSLGPKLKQHFIFKACHLKEMKALKRILWLKTFLTHKTTHLASTSPQQFLLIVKLKKNKKEKLLHSQGRDSIQKIQQISGPWWEWSSQIHVGCLCVKVSFLKYLW